MRRSRLYRCPSLALAPCLALWVSFGAAPGHALPPCTSRIDVQPVPGAGAQLGGSVATDGAIVASGAHEDSAAAPGAGAIYVLQRGGSVRLTAADAAAHDLLGFALAIEGSTLVAGAPLGDAPGAADAGAVYVFSRPGSSWSAAAPQVKLTAPNARRNDQFGQALALSGDRIAVGAPDRSGLSGAVYVFKRSGGAWTLEAEIDDPDAASFDAFGSALALDGDTLAVGAPFANNPGRGRAGAVHVFVREGASWVRRARIVDPEGLNGDEVGFSLALSGETLVAGARRADVFGLVDAGIVLVFARADATGAQWTRRAKLTAVHPGADDLFGIAVAIGGSAGSRIVVGARNHDAGGHNAGAGFVFDSLTDPPLVLLGMPPEPGAALGQSVAAFGDSVVLGAHLADTGGRVDSGALLACPSPLAGPVCPATGVTKSDGLASVERGQTITYRIEVTDAAPGAVVTDDFSAILFNGFWCRGDQCEDFRPGPLADTLANGGAAVYRVRGRVGLDVPGEIENRVRVEADGCPTREAFDRDRVSGDGHPFPADLFCAKSGPASARTGDEVTYTIAVGNQGERAAQSVVLHDPLPAGLAFVRADSPCAADGTCALGTIVGGGVRNLHFTYRVTAAGPAVVSNVASATGSVADPTPGDSTCGASTTIEAPPPPPKADLGVELAVPEGPLACGVPFTFRVTVTNQGPDVAVAMFAVVSAPGISGPPFCTPHGAGPDSLVCLIGSLGPNANTVVTLTGQAPGTGPCGGTPPMVSITASAASSTTDPNPQNDAVEETREVACPAAASSFAITKSDGRPAVQPGQNLLYTIGVTNTGDCPAAAEVEDLLPPQVEEFRWCRGAGCTPATASELHDSIELPPGGTAIYQVGGQASPFATGSISNTALVRFDEGDESSATDVDAIVLPLGVTCLCAGINGPFVEMENITYTFVCHNGGPFPQQDNPGNEFLDPLPGTLMLLNASATSGTTALLPGGIMAWNGAIPVGGQVTITVTAKIQPGTAGNTICNQGQVAFDADGNGTNESGGLTDDPDLPGNADPCCFKVLFNFVPSIPTLAPTGVIFFILLVMIGALVRLRKRN
ncbi:MAG TPA: hypothetical protein VGS22_01250 [Thermoanaerobaculia bacterium]|jgi:uncharacterized repeat protein (TIGR01451 family)|nr:hypothetical protein [Thermoanaerobaculia bacterium]